MNRIAVIILAGLVALGTTASVALTASHEMPAPVSNTVKPPSEWQVPSSVATVSLVPSDFIAPDKSYSGHQATPAPTVAPCQEDEPCWNCHTMGNRICGPAPVAVAPVYVAPKPVPTVHVTGVAVEPHKAAVATPKPVATQAPVATAPTAKPSPSVTCPPLQHKDGVNMTPPNAPSYCVYAQ